MNTDLAIIFKTNFDLENKEIVTYTPYKVIEGVLYGDSYFQDTTGKNYTHITLEEGEDYCFAFPASESSLLIDYPSKNTSEIKKHLLASASSYKYFRNYNNNDVYMYRIGSKKKHLLKDNCVDIRNNTMRELVSKLGEISFEVSSSDDFEYEPYQDSKEEPSRKKTPFVKKELDIKKMYDYVTKRIMGQDDPMRKLVSSLYQNYTSGVANNILINGQSGVGKTKSITLLSEIIDIPVSIIDVSAFTQSGYVGSSVSEILETVYENANGDLDLAERSIVVLDELDKKAGLGDGREKVAGVGVLNELLGYLSGNTYSVKTASNIPGVSSSMNIDTRNMTFIGLGAFSGIEDTVKRQVGFGENHQERNYQDMSNDNFIDYGFTPELLGRFPVKIKMNSLTEDDLIKILKYSEISPLSSKIKYFKDHFKVEFICPDDVLGLIAKIAIKEQTGARSLFEKIENIVSADIIFDLAVNQGKYSKVILTKESIHNPKKYILR